LLLFYPIQVMNKRLAAAMGAYAVLIAVAVYLLKGVLLYAVLTLYGLLILKSLIAIKAGWLTSDSNPEQSIPEADSKMNHAAPPDDGLQH
jgi:hypothetical protein